MEVGVPIVDDGKARSDILLFNRRTYDDVQVTDLSVLLLHQSTQSTCLTQLEGHTTGRLWIWSSQFKGEDNPCDWSNGSLVPYKWSKSKWRCIMCRKENSTCLVALGIDDGEVFTINATPTELKWKSSGHYHSRIAALSFANKGHKVYAIRTYGTTCKMNFEADDKILAASNTKIRVLTLDDGKELLKFSTDVVCSYLLRDLVESGHALLKHAYHNLQEYERYEGGTRICDSDGIRICDSIPMPNKRSLILSEGGARISDSDRIGICDYVGIRIYDSIPLPNQRNLIISEGGTRISDYDRIGIGDSNETKTLQNSNENQNCKRTF
ncbi:unnamed protein product [Lactuca saligna]|uniref:Uncharacterized protein n=1 Tax=Lactuca saligna TaxID=75948 RepID=A0AA36ECX7_LACSI|nr:unnamed protein product [Lactuca saligna]